MIVWDISGRLEKKGWTNPQQLATGAGLTYPVASRVWKAAHSGERVDRIDTTTLETLADALKVRDPFKLLKRAR